MQAALRVFLSVFTGVLSPLPRLVMADIAPITPLGQVIASLIMILGYGIIAVPTGIVTAEFARGRNSGLFLNLRNPCVNCGTEDHRENADYCYHCGHPLHDEA